MTITAPTRCVQMFTVSLWTINNVFITFLGESYPILYPCLMCQFSCMYFGIQSQLAMDSVEMFDAERHPILSCCFPIEDYQMIILKLTLKQKINVVKLRHKKLFTKRSQLQGKGIDLDLRKMLSNFMPAQKTDYQAIFHKFHCSYIRPDFIIVQMQQEIKLIILLILSFCTYLKVKNFKTPKKTAISEFKAIETTGDDIQNDVNQVDEFDFEELARIDNELFPPQSAYKRQLRKEEARNDEYRKTIMTESSFDTESTLIYNNSYFEKSLFGPLANKPIYTNEEYLKEIEHLIVDPVLSPMKVEEEVVQKKSIPALSLSTPKKKSILKQKRFGKRAGQPTPQKKSAKKKKSVFDIDQQIKKREEQIKVLRRMRQNQLLL